MVKKPSLGVRQRVLLAFLLLAVTGVASSLWNLTVQLDNKADIERIHKKSIPTLVAAYEIARQSEGISASTSSLILKKDKWARSVFIGRIADQFNWINLQLGTISRLGYDTEKINNVKHNGKALQKSFDDLIKALENAEIDIKSHISKGAKRASLMNAEVRHKLLKHKRYADIMSFSVADLTGSLSREIDRVVLKTQTRINKAILQLALYSLISLIFTLLVVLYMDRNISRRVVGIQHAMRAIADGKGNEEIPHGGNDEISDMGAALGTFVEKLEEREGQLKKAHDNLEAEVKKRTSELVKEIRERKQAEKKVSESLSEKEVLLQEIHHRVKNNLQVVSSMLSLQSRTENDDKVIAALMESRRRIEVMARVHESLYQSPDLSNIPVKNFIKTIISEELLNPGRNSDGISLRTKIGEMSMDLDTAVTCGQIVSELASNSVKHAFPDGRKGMVTVVIRHAPEGQVELSVMDNGIGLPDGFDLATTKSMGLKLVRTLAKKIDGKIYVNCDNGTCVSVYFKSQV